MPCGLRFCLAFVAGMATWADAGDCVVLLHGLGRSAGSMKPLAVALDRAGFQPAVFSYSSRRTPLANISDSLLLPTMTKLCPDPSARIHFVTHSLGGMVVRDLLSRHAIPRLGRVVMLAPPNQGSEAADFYRRIPPARWWLGPNLGRLGTESGAEVFRLPPPPCPFGVIAATRSIDPITSLAIPGDDDGKVPVIRTRLEGMADWISFPVSHAFIMRDRRVARAVIRFLQEGNFGPDGEATRSRIP